MDGLIVKKVGGSWLETDYGLPFLILGTLPTWLPRWVMGAASQEPERDSPRSVSFFTTPIIRSRARARAPPPTNQPTHPPTNPPGEWKSRTPTGGVEIPDRPLRRKGGDHGDR